MGASDLFAPPTDAELKGSGPPSAPSPGGSASLFSPPTDDELKASAPDPRTTSEKWQDLFIGNHPNPNDPLNNPPEWTPEKRADYARRLPATLASAGAMFLPIPGSPLAAIGALGAQGAGIGALEPADSGTQRLKNAVLGGATAASIGGAAEAVGAGARAAWPAIKSVGSKIAETVTGVPRQEVLTYGEQGPAIKDMMEQAGGSLPAAADTVREGWQQAIQDKRKALGAQIANTLKSSPQNKTESIQPILDALDSQKAKLDPALHADAISSIDDLSSTIQQSAPGGQASANKMNLIKQFLQDRAKNAYMKAGQIFQTAPQAAQAARSAGGEARGILNGMEPKVADANNQLAALHDVEDMMNSNLIAPGKPDAAVMAAGSGANPRNAMVLDQLGQMTGVDMKGQAQQLAAARTFTKPAWSPSEMNGKSVYRAGAGALLGGLAAYEGDKPIVGGALIGGAMASPGALKLAIDAGRIPVGIAQKFGPGALAAISRSTPMIASGVVGANQPASAPAQDTQGRQLASPAKGEAAWAQRGLEALSISDPALSSRLIQDPKARALLIQAGGVSPGSKAMKAIQSKIQKGWGTP